MVVKSEYNQWVFGGYTSRDWDASVAWKNDPKAFLFQLHSGNPKYPPAKFQNNPEACCILSDKSSGPKFGREVPGAEFDPLYQGKRVTLGVNGYGGFLQMGFNDMKRFCGRQDVIGHQLMECEVYKVTGAYKQLKEIIWRFKY